MKSKLEILEIMQLIISKKGEDDFSFGYGEAVKDLAILLGENPDNYGFSI